jgi:hypothetical protein
MLLRLKAQFEEIVLLKKRYWYPPLLAHPWFLQPDVFTSCVYMFPGSVRWSIAEFYLCMLIAPVWEALTQPRQLGRWFRNMRGRVQSPLVDVEDEHVACCATAKSTSAQENTDLHTSRMIVTVASYCATLTRPSHMGSFRPQRPDWAGTLASWSSGDDEISWCRYRITESLISVKAADRAGFQAFLFYSEARVVNVSIIRRMEVFNVEFKRSNHTIFRFNLFRVG